MERRTARWLILTAFIFLCVCSSACAEGGPDISLRASDWSWEQDGISRFEGDVSFGDSQQGTIILKLSQTAEPSDTVSGEAVFLSVNGKQLSMKKQKDEYTYTPDNSEPLSFTGYWKSDRKTEARKVVIQIQVCTEDGALLKEASCTIERGSDDAAETKQEGSFVLDQIDRWILYAGIAALLIWVCAIIRMIQSRRKKDEHADLQ